MFFSSYSINIIAVLAELEHKVNKGGAAPAATENKVKIYVIRHNERRLGSLKPSSCR